MNVPHKTYDGQKIESSQKPLIPTQWIVIPACILILFSLMIFTNDNRALSATAAAPADVQLNPPAGDGKQIQRNEAMARTMDPLATTPSIWPISGAVTSGFGWRNSPWADGNEFHPGIDIAATMGAPVVATADGEVVKTGWAGGYGNIVQISHGNGIETVYGHNSQIAVSVGQSIKKGQVISYAGSTGRSTGPHVHYEVRVNGTAVDPTKFLVLY